MLRLMSAAAAISLASLAAAQAPATSWPSTPEEHAYLERIAVWIKQCVDVCSADNAGKPCEKICTDAGAHLIGCAAGNRPFCDEARSDEAKRERYNAQRRSPTPEASPPDAMIACLQSTAGAVVARCRETKCDPALLVDIIGEAQKISCGYTAIQEPSLPLNPSTSRCTTTQVPSGSWITNCTQF